jgi:hypothetical protein
MAHGRKSQLAEGLRHNCQATQAFKKALRDKGLSGLFGKTWLGYFFIFSMADYPWPPDNLMLGANNLPLFPKGEGGEMLAIT